MATLELDPLYLKALKLLHSKSKDSTNQLRLLLEDTIAKRKEEQGQDPEKTRSEPAKREAEKRSIEALKKDLSELSGKPDMKKPRLDNEEEKKRPDKVKLPIQKSVKPPEDKIKKSGTGSEKDTGTIVEISDESDTGASASSNSMDAGDFAFGMGISCVVCREFSCTSGNQLVECQECHSLYHQECHKPPVTVDVNDPRYVWYCHKCSKNMKKKIVQKSQPTKSKSSHSLASAKDRDSNGGGSGRSNSRSSGKGDAALPFRRNQLESIKASTKDSVSTKGSGLAALAANLSSREKVSTLRTFDFLSVKSGPNPPKSKLDAKDKLSLSGSKSKGTSPGLQGAKSGGSKIGSGNSASKVSTTLSNTRSSNTESPAAKREQAMKKMKAITKSHH